MIKTPYAITSLITTHGVDITYRQRPIADSTAPWKPVSRPEVEAVIFKGLIQHLRADHNDRLPEGGVKAVMVLLATHDQPNPLPGDELVHDKVTWRANTVIPISAPARRRLGGQHPRLLEVIVRSRGMPDGP